VQKGMFSEINHLLVDIFRSILSVEEQTLRTTRLDLNIGELHILETIGQHCRKDNAGCSMSQIAQDQEITLPSATVAIQKLEKKGFVQKVRSKKDARVVRVTLTRSGRRADAAHRYFHEQMVRSLLREASDEQAPILLSALKNLNEFVHKQAAEAMALNQGIYPAGKKALS